MDIDCSVVLPQVMMKLFPSEAQRNEVFMILSAYGRENFHREVQRVHLGILKISGSDIEKIRRATSLACSDFRDLLVEAEFPLSFGKDKLRERDPEKYAKHERKEQDQYRQWLAKLLAA